MSYPKFPPVVLAHPNCRCTIVDGFAFGKKWDTRTMGFDTLPSAPPPPPPKRKTPMGRLEDLIREEQERELDDEQVQEQPPVPVRKERRIILED